ncbi:MAG: AEC family transporter [Parachlamydiaceae bacterium]|nr:AEC family transporter [Parachlamydiaceae bacterium]
MIVLFYTLLLKIAPLYMNILLGFAAGKLLGTPRDVLGRLMFYMINPIIMFNGILYTKIDAGVLSLPVLIFVVSCSLCLLFYFLASYIWKDSTRNLAAFSAGSGNTGYFGLPLVLMLLDKQGEGVYMMAMMGISLYENSLGFYICAKGTHTPRECALKLFKLPTVYAFLVALTLNVIGTPIPVVFQDFICHIKGTFVVLGMMIIGVGLAGLTSFKLDFKFVGLTFLAKFVVWPTIILGVIALDMHFLHLFSRDIYDALILLSIVPLAVNTVVLASVLHAQPEKAAVTVMLGTLFALLYVPFMVITFMPEAAATFGRLFCTL